MHFNLLHNRFAMCFRNLDTVMQFKKVKILENLLCAAYICYHFRNYWRVSVVSEMPREKGRGIEDV